MSDKVESEELHGKDWFAQVMLDDLPDEKREELRQTVRDRDE